MRRRTILACLPALLSGCTGLRSATNDDTPTGAPSRTPTTAPTDPPTATSTETPTDSPTPAPDYSLIPADPQSMTTSEVRSALIDRDCTGLAEKPMICPGEDGRLSVSLSTDVASLSEEIELVVRNGADATFGFNDYDWTLYKHDGRSWRFLAPLEVPISETILESSGSYDYRIGVGESAIYDPVQRATVPVTMTGLGPGVYGFVDESGNFQGEEESLAFGAAFGFAGEGPTVCPTDEVTGVEQSGDTLTVRADDEVIQKRALELSFVETADATLLAEHVRLLDELRNALAYAAAHDVETVRYATSDGAVETVLLYLDLVTSSDANRYRFRDYRFEVGKAG